MPMNEIEELKDSFVKELLPLRIHLFGSFAEGKQNADSDFDFYIVVDDSQKDMLDLTTKAYKSIRHKRKRPVDIIVNTEERFESKKTSPVSVEGEVARKGVLLYEASKNGGIKIGMFKGEEYLADDYDFDQDNDVIAQLFEGFKG